MSLRASSPPSLILNAIALRTDWDASIRVGQLNCDGPEALAGLRAELGPTHVVRRRGNRVEIAAADPTSAIPGELVQSKAGDIKHLLAWRLSEWLVEHFAATGRQLFRRRRPLVVVSNRPEDNLLQSVVPQNFSLPDGIAFQATFELDVRVERPTGNAQVFVTIESRARPQIDTPVGDLVAAGVSVEGLYVQRAEPAGDPRLADPGRLTGRVKRMNGRDLILADHEEGWSTIQASKARLEPRMEVLAHVLAQLAPAAGTTRDEILEKLRNAAGRLSTGPKKLERIRSMTGYLGKQQPALLDGHVGEFSNLISTHRRFPRYEVVSKPSLIFDTGGTRTNRWNQRGLDKHGPFDRYQFNPKRLNIALVCQQDRQGRVEQFTQQLLQGVPKEVGAPGASDGDLGFLRRFSLEKPYVKVFVARNASATAYRQAAIEAVEHITDRGESWNLALVQTEEAMEALLGDDNPYLTMKAFFLAKGIAAQHVHFETMNQPRSQLVYSLNNVGLACYAKLGGVPWLLPSDQTVAHELVIGHR